MPSPVIGTDKLGHLALFGVVLWAGVRAGIGLRVLLIALAINSVVSEVAQYLWLAKRSGDPWDTVADLLGLGVGWLVLRWGDRRRAARALRPPGDGAAASVASEASVPAANSDGARP